LKKKDEPVLQEPVAPQQDDEQEENLPVKQKVLAKEILIKIQQDAQLQEEQRVKKLIASKTKKRARELLKLQQDAQLQQEEQIKKIAKPPQEPVDIILPIGSVPETIFEEPPVPSRPKKNIVFDTPQPPSGIPRERVHYLIPQAEEQIRTQSTIRQPKTKASPTEPITKKPKKSVVGMSPDELQVANEVKLLFEKSQSQQPIEQPKSKYLPKKQLQQNIDTVKSIELQRDINTTRTDIEKVLSLQRVIKQETEKKEAARQEAARQEAQLLAMREAAREAAREEAAREAANLMRAAREEAAKAEKKAAALQKVEEIKQRRQKEKEAEKKEKDAELQKVERTVIQPPPSSSLPDDEPPELKEATAFVKDEITGEKRISFTQGFVVNPPLPATPTLSTPTSSKPKSIFITPPPPSQEPIFITPPPSQEPIFITPTSSQDTPTTPTETEEKKKRAAKRHPDVIAQEKADAERKRIEKAKAKEEKEKEEEEKQKQKEEKKRVAQAKADDAERKRIERVEKKEKEDKEKEEKAKAKEEKANVKPKPPSQGTGLLNHREQTTHRFKVLKGELLAGNTSKLVVNEMKSLVKRLVQMRELTNDQCLLILKELKTL